MFVEFSKLNGLSRVWIFQSTKVIDDITINLLKEDLFIFLENWKSHQNVFESSFVIKYNTFIVVAADESTLVSGCSIDSLVNFIKILEKKYSLFLLDKLNIKYKIGQEIKTVGLKQFKDICENLNLSEKLTVFNNLVKNISDFKTNWETDVRKSRHTKYLTND